MRPSPAIPFGHHNSTAKNPPSRLILTDPQISIRSSRRIATAQGPTIRNLPAGHRRPLYRTLPKATIPFQALPVFIPPIALKQNNAPLLGVTMLPHVTRYHALQILQTLGCISIAFFGLLVTNRMLYILQSGGNDPNDHTNIVLLMFSDVVLALLLMAQTMNIVRVCLVHCSNEYEAQYHEAVRQGLDLRREAWERMMREAEEEEEDDGRVVQETRSQEDEVERQRGFWMEAAARVEQSQAEYERVQRRAAAEDLERRISQAYLVFGESSRGRRHR
jgi:hypothetical protein